MIVKLQRVVARDADRFVSVVVQRAYAGVSATNVGARVSDLAGRC